MEFSDYQAEVLNWAPGATRFDRMEFLKTYLMTLTDDELTQVKNLAAKRKKRNYRKRHYPTPLAADTAAAKPASTSEPDSSASELGVGEAAAVSPRKPRHWFEDWSNEDIVSFDVEKVTLREKEPGKKKYTVCAGSVAVVNAAGKVLMDKKVFHKPGSYMVNNDTRRVNGFEDDSLKDGLPLEEVKKELLEHLRGKLVITCAGEDDFAKFGLSGTQFDHFDIQWHWKELKINEHGVQVQCTVGLRHIYYYYFKKDFQAGVHTPSSDAQATMKLFLEKYMDDCKSKGIYSMNDSDFFHDFPRLKV